VKLGTLGVNDSGCLFDSAIVVQLGTGGTVSLCLLNEIGFILEAGYRKGDESVEKLGEGESSCVEPEKKKRKREKSMICLLGHWRWGSVHRTADLTSHECLVRAILNLHSYSAASLRWNDIYCRRKEMLHSTRLHPSLSPHLSFGLQAR
jgi:hypothetical protein